MGLRPYQEQAVEAVRDRWLEWDRELLVMATGTGKTRTAKAIIEDRLQHGPVLFIAHRDELIEQARSTFGDAGKIKADTTDIRPVTVGSIQTLVNRNRYDFNTVIVDEAHHCVSDSYRKVLDMYCGSKVLGLTATPDRKGLGDVFDGIAFEYGLRQAVIDGYLSPIVARTVPIDIDMTNVRIKAGDFELNAVAETLRPYLPEIARSIREFASDRKTLVFLPLVAIAQEFRDILESEGIPAREVNGASADRAETLQWFKDGPRGIALCNAMLLTEGVDLPDCDCVVCLRPTKVRSLYSQIVGRGTRLAPGKRDCLVLDFLWLSTRHDLCKPACLLTDNQDDIDAVAKNAADGEIDIMEGLVDVVEQRRNALAAQLASNARKKARLIDPLQYFVDADAMAAADFVPEFAWQMQPATEKQLKMIEGAGINPDGMCKGQASLVIDTILNRRKQGLATAKQVRMLRQKGFREPSQWTMEQASKMMGILANNRWIVPSYIDPATYMPG